MSDSWKTPFGIVRILIVLVVLAAIVRMQIITGIPPPNWTFLFGSVMIVILALVNFLEKRNDSNLSRFVLLMFIAMMVCSIADFLMASVFYIIPGESLINGVIFFLTGHVIYILALRNRSPLLLRGESPRLIVRNLVIWIVGLVVLFVLFFLTLFNPAKLVISIGLVGYGIFLTSSLVFSITKWFDNLPHRFSLCLILGFTLFFISDYILGYRILIDGDFLNGIEAVGITYLLGQMIIHLSPVFASE
ncbi:MAG: lysoplasmalogenase family protein [Candidatus Thorarchaeota archaeon]